MPTTTCERNPTSPATPSIHPREIVHADGIGSVSTVPATAEMRSHANATRVCQVAQSGRGRAAGGGRFVAMDYAQVAEGGLAARADVVICNFSLLGGESVDRLLRAVPALLHDGGTLLIQTLHPWTACGDAPYRDGWRDGSWAGCGEGFGDAAPWYFRSMAGWMAGFRDAGLALVGLEEPLHPDTGRPASAIFALRPVSPLP